MLVSLTVWELWILCHARDRGIDPLLCRPFWSPHFPWKCFSSDPKFLSRSATVLSHLSLGLSSLLLTKFNMVISSAYFISDELMWTAYSASTIQAKKGPRTIPYGTSFLTSAQFESDLFILIAYSLSSTPDFSSRN